jgi:tripartite ATP-independent transporter DctM subunit
MLLLAAVTMADVLLRWLLNTAIPGLNEVVGVFTAVAVAACLPAGLARGVNLKVDIVAHWLPRRHEAWFNAAAAIVLAAVFGILTWQLLRSAGQLWGEGRTTVILELPLAPVIDAVAALCGLGTLVQSAVAANAVRRAARLPAAPSSRGGRILAAAIVLPLLAFAAVAMFDFAGMAAWTQAHVGLAVILAFLLMWVMMLGLVPLLATLAIVGVVGSALFVGWTPALDAATGEVSGFLTNSQISVLPLFLMMGSFAAVSDIAEDAYRLAYAVLGRLRGGLALAAIGGCAGFGALTGSSLATTAVISRVSLPEMIGRGYSPALATGSCAAGGTLAALMPPASGALIIYAFLTESSVGKLFVAALMPALLAVLMFFATVMIYVRVAPGSAQVAPARVPGEVTAALRRCSFAAVLFGTVLGGVYSGVFTPTEAGAVGAVEAFLCALVRGKLKGGAFWQVMAETTQATAMVYGLLLGAQVFSFFISISALTESATAFAQTLNLSPLGLIAWILGIYLVLGSVMDAWAVMIITVPIVSPLIAHMGYDLAWWGIINLCVVETGVIHPPLGTNVFLLKSMQPDVSIWTIYRGVFPFVVTDLVKLAILVLFPSITLWLTTMQ